MKCLLLKPLFLISLFAVFSMPSFAQNDREQGLEQFKQENYQDAIKILEPILKKDKEDAEALYTVGASYYRLDKLKEAEKAFKKLAKLRPNEPKSYLGLAYISLNKNKLNDAQQKARKVIELDKDAYEGYVIYGIAELREGSYESSQKSAEQVISANPKFAPAYLLKSEALIYRHSASLGDAPKPGSDKYYLLREAVASLEQHLRLLKNPKEIEFQSERLEGLKSHAEYVSKPGQREDLVRSPLRIISQPRAPYTDSARQNNVQGAVRLGVGFLPNGTIGYITVLNGLRNGLTENALKALKKMKFEPERINGKPIIVLKMIEYRFTLY